MDKKNNDRRVLKTKKQLRQGLTELLKEKSIKDISVRELSERVDINRGTFYLHYKNIFDMVEQIQSEMLNDFHNVLDKHPSKSLNGKPLPILIDLFRVVAKNSDICKVLIVNNGDVAFLNQLKDLVKNRCLNDFMEVFNTGKSQNFEYFSSFIVSGCIGLLQSWLDKGLKESPEHMAMLAEQMILTGIKVIQ
ncbi:TetR/AcrR family transcriptional regulator [Defluviitalea raffinosedens]|uniref:TetR family transcriptional regulator n=1 Tax=Defluviitalea raffinosedens TaxID=1450156 RepID=A0A7C8LDF4_9FIRM|nr:TetR-like C-terminal domain-containing protein [Defluviitalea raffinosedens]KAE9631222.1 TetR family transcriptional regulator [Defluviitalea raffinosedens]MBM7686240.1 AcrR family transcriptional regulator [Defluviitalea raffinosedens]HHW68591.1 TetR/AcrR family transcriptional regulator [Candidatus Epulonipiscium sp.]